MTFHVLTVGSIRGSDLDIACTRYEKRIRRFGKLTIREVPHGRARQPDAVLRLERDRLLNALPRAASAVALVRAGTVMPSVDFSRQVAKWRLATRDIVFIIGGAHGLHHDVVKACTGTLSLSPLTFSHDIARLVLLEQLYRAYTILNRQPYHKGD